MNGEVNSGTWLSRLGILKSEAVKYTHDFLGNQHQERKSWQGPATTENYRPILSLETAPHMRKLITIYEHFKKRKRIWFLFPDGCLTPRQTG
jgi:hypothetical protein